MPPRTAASSRSGCAVGRSPSGCCATGCCCSVCLSSSPRAHDENSSQLLRSHDVWVRCAGGRACLSGGGGTLLVHDFDSCVGLSLDDGVHREPAAAATDRRPDARSPPTTTHADTSPRPWPLRVRAVSERGWRRRLALPGAGWCKARAGDCSCDERTVATASPLTAHRVPAAAPAHVMMTYCCALR